MGTKCYTIQCIFNGEEKPFPAIGDAAYHQDAGGGPSHGHTVGNMHKTFSKGRARGSGDILADKQTDR